MPPLPLPALPCPAPFLPPTERTDGTPTTTRASTARATPPSAAAPTLRTRTASTRPALAASPVSTVSCRRCRVTSTRRPGCRWAAATAARRASRASAGACCPSATAARGCARATPRRSATASASSVCSAAGSRCHSMRRATLTHRRWPGCCTLACKRRADKPRLATVSPVPVPGASRGGCVQAGGSWLGVGKCICSLPLPCRGFEFGIEFLGGLLGLAPGRVPVARM